MSDHRESRWRTRIIINIAIVSALSFVAWRSINYVSGNGFGIDSGVFASSASQILSGKVLYRDIFDHKPPMIHLIDTLALGLGDRTINSIRFVERIFAVAGGLLFYFIALSAFNNKSISFVTTLLFLFLFYHPSSFEGGNLTEEYGSVFALAGILSVLRTRNADARTVRFSALCVLSGLFFSLAALSKEPFLLTAIPWFAYLLFNRPEWMRSAIPASVYFLGGGIIPILVFLAYLVTTGALGDWIDVLSFNLRTSAMSDQHFSFLEGMRANFEPASKALIGVTISARAAFIAGVFSLMSRSTLRECNYVPLALGAMFVFDYVGTMLSGRGYGHYYMQLAASFILMGGCAAAFLVRCVEKGRHAYTAKIGLYVASLALILLVDFSACRIFAGRIGASSMTCDISGISSEVMRRTNPHELVWSPVDVTCLYAETGRLSPTKYQYAFPHLFIDTWKNTRKEKFNILKNDLLRRPPKVMVLSTEGRCLLVDCGISEWVSMNYRMTPYTWKGSELSVAVHVRP